VLGKFVYFGVNFCIKYCKESYNFETKKLYQIEEILPVSIAYVLYFIVVDDFIDFVHG